MMSMNINHFNLKWQANGYQSNKPNDVASNKYRGNERKFQLPFMLCARSENHVKDIGKWLYDDRSDVLTLNHVMSTSNESLFNANSFVS